MNKLLTILLSCCLLFAIGRPAYGEDVSYQIKASYIYNLLQFVTFPAGSVQASQLNVCIVGENYFGSSLNSIDGANTPQGTLHIHLIGSFADRRSLESCNVLYLTKSEKNKTQSILSSINSKNVFTIAEYPSFLSSGGLVELFTQDDRIRFHINRRLVKRANFQIAAQLLQLGTSDI